MVIIPIWVTDPTGNNNPRLSTPIGFFVAWQKACFDNSDPQNQIQNAQMFWSSDGLSWTQTSTPGSDLSSAQAGAFTFAQGMIMAGGTYQVGDAIAGGSFAMYTLNGKSWTMALAATGTVAFGYTVGTGVWNITLNGNPATTFSNPFFNGPTLSGDTVSNHLADPHFTSAASPSVLANALPDGLTAVRNIGSPFEYSLTPITTAVVNSGAAWPDANFITGETWPVAGGTFSGGTATVIYGKFGR